MPLVVQGLIVAVYSQSSTTSFSFNLRAFTPSGIGTTNKAFKECQHFEIQAHAAFATLFTQKFMASVARDIVYGKCIPSTTVVEQLRNFCRGGAT